MALSRLALAACIVAALLAAAPASAHHSPGYYSGTIAGGGTIAFSVESHYSIDGYSFDGAQTTCGPYSSYGAGTIEIVNHAFEGPKADWVGSFPENGKAQGTLRARFASGCVSEPVAWTATTTAPPPPQCSDGGDNDGDGRIDSGQYGQDPATYDPGCDGMKDDDETDPSAPGDTADTTPPVLSALDVLSRKVFYRLSEDAEVRLKVERCRKRRGSKCTRWKRYPATLVDRGGEEGPNSIALPRTIGGVDVKPGRHRITATPTDARGNVGEAVRRKFTIAR